jgi:copper(I)-binding protein
MNRWLGVVVMMAVILAASLASPVRADHGGTPVAGESTPVPTDDHSGRHDHAMTGTGAAYLHIANGGDAADRLIGAAAEVAEVVEIHEIASESGVMQMRPLVDGLEVAAGEVTVLEPGGYHIMLIGLTRSLEPGMTYELTLTFENAGEVTVPVVVQPMAPAEDDALVVEAGDLIIRGAWSRPAPMISDAMPHATPAATPAA